MTDHIIKWHMGTVDISQAPPAVFFSGFPPLPGETSREYFRRVNVNALIDHAREIEAARRKWWQFWRP